jgi:hypothetical protein
MQLTFADITLPGWLVVSQWALLFALGFLIIMMFRQVALLEQHKDRGSDRAGLQPGEKAHSFDYIPLNRTTNAPARFEPRGRWSLLLFADPSCVSCQNTLLALEKLSPHLAQSVQVLVATTSEPDLISASDAFRLTSFELGQIPVDVSTRLYNTGVTPFGHLIDPAGVVHAKGTVTDEASLRKLVRHGDAKPVNVEFTIS